MSEGELPSTAPGSITIEQLIALNDEIAALVRAGIPLERGLMVAGRDLHGRLGRITTALGTRLGRGESLVEALAGEGKSIPALYRAVVEAGARSGRLPVALEGLSRYVRGYSEARSAIGLALWYPVLVLCLAYALFVGLVTLVVPRFVEAFDSLRLTAPAPLRWLEWFGNAAGYWWPAGPILIAFLGIAWVGSGKAVRFQSRGFSWLRALPWMNSLLNDYETANFAELLALLLEHHVAYPRALVLAAESTGNRRLVAGARQLSEAITRGEPVKAALASADRRSILPMLRWVLASGQEQGSLVTALHNLTELYRKRARYQAEKLYVLLPVLLLIAVGASATLLYALALFLPVINMLYQLAS
ncbi:MAG: type II secretion system F family protein [Isosphaeraceae bacterium]